MKTDIFQLKIIPISNICPHEKYDKRRAGPLIKSLKKDNRITNPIIVASFGNKKYLQLDGMNRLSAFKIMKKPTIIAQIVDYNDQGTVELSSWCHLFKTGEKAFIRSISRIRGIEVKQGKLHHVGYRYIKAKGPGRLCTVVSRRGNVYLIHTNNTLLDKIKKLNKLVSFYKKKIIRDALPLIPSPVDIELSFQKHFNTNLMMVFPTFTRHQIIDIVSNGGLFPTGVTRHIIQRRCLNLNISLSFFASKKTLEEQNRELEKILTNRNFRLYEEQTIYFE